MIKFGLILYSYDLEYLLKTKNNFGSCGVTLLSDTPTIYFVFSLYPEITNIRL